MYENIIQNLSDITGLAGLEEDEDLQATTEAKTTFYRAFRSYYIAQAFIMAQKWPEAMAVFQRALQYSAKVIFFYFKSFIDKNKRHQLQFVFLYIHVLNSKVQKQQKCSIIQAKCSIQPR